MYLGDARGPVAGTGASRCARGAVEARQRSVEALARRFNGANEHGNQVARLGLKLFDGTTRCSGCPPSARELLEYAALLHDIGHSIDHDRHNRHSYYLIKNAELLGFSPVEIEMIAQTARGHRKQAAQIDFARIAEPERRKTTVGARSRRDFARRRRAGP